MSTTKQKSENNSAAVVLAAVEKNSSKLFKQLASIKIGNKQQYENAGKLLKELKQQKAAAVEKEKSITVPLEKAKKETIALFKPFYTKVDTTEQLVKSLMLEFDNAQQQEIKKLGAKLESGEIKRVGTYLRKVDELEVKSSGAIQQRTIKELVCVDTGKTPREFLAPDEAAIKKALLSGQTVPGWKLSDKKTLVI